tara:strand:+ start:523 stop:912 length:390 start_codon:yes stop_codon:yes gene_type:complete
MKSFIVYAQNGTILRTGSCPDAMFDLQKDADELIMEGVANDASKIIQDGKIVEKPAPSDTLKNDAAILELRLRRDLILASTDWTQLPDSPLSDSAKNEWQEYREKLRNLPSENQDILDIDDVSFPAPPA